MKYLLDTNRIDESTKRESHWQRLGGEEKWEMNDCLMGMELSLGVTKVFWK